MKVVGLKVLIVTDSDPATDRRVAALRQELNSASAQITVLDITKYRDPGAFSPVGLIGSLRDFLNAVTCKPDRITFNYLLEQDAQLRTHRFRADAFLYTAYVAIRSFYRARRWKETDAGSYDVIVANDLQAGLFAGKFYELALAQKKAPRPISFYDIHEFSPFRRKTASWPRMMLEARLEQWVVSQLRHVGCVSEPLRVIYHELYNPASSHSLPNNYYPRVKQKARFHNNGLLTIVYFGAVVPGRSIRSLLSMAQQDASLHVYIICPAFSAFHEGMLRQLRQPNITVIRDVDYSGAMDSILDSHRCVLSWCVIEKLCLSYEHAQPSKFYQSMRYGIPVIALSNGTLHQNFSRYGICIAIETELLTNGDQLVKTIRSEVDKRGSSIYSNVEAFEQAMPIAVGWSEAFTRISGGYCSLSMPLTGQAGPR